jgi:hypothetical protein
MAAKLKIEKRGDEILIKNPVIYAKKLIIMLTVQMWAHSGLK